MKINHISVAKWELWATTQNIFFKPFSTRSLFSLTYQPHKSLHNDYKSYPWGISLFPKGWEQTHTCCFILQTMWWIFYEVWSSITSMKETPKEGWVSVLLFPLLWFISHSSKLTFTRTRNGTDCGYTYPQEICDLYYNNLYCVSYICLCYLKEKANSCAPNLFCPWGGQIRWGLTLSQSRED